MAAKPDAERQRLEEARTKGAPWRRWGPYLSERQWGTVREDTSPDGNAWDSFPHDQASWRAYRWGEDGLAGFSDDRQRLCFALALWNGKDPILKERLFGLTNGQGNHGEDVKEYYFYLDALPSHAWMRWLYKYPQAAYPFERLIEENRKRGRAGLEYELIDTGVFDDDRYFDVVVEYAKASPEDLLVRIRATNRGPDPAPLHVLPHLWFRNTWSWGGDAAKPTLERVKGPQGTTALKATHAELGERLLVVEGDVPTYVAENETGRGRPGAAPNASPHGKDAIHRRVVDGARDAVSPEGRGTKAAFHLSWTLAPGETKTVRLRLSPAAKRTAPFGPEFDATCAQRLAEADAFYAALSPRGTTSDEALVLRQAYAGLLWSKQAYHYDVGAWLEGRGAKPGTAGRGKAPRNGDWAHLASLDVLSMPDKWEYPWYAAWDLAFHAFPLAAVDLDFAKEQLELLLKSTHLHPNGQIPAYEWNFSDVNPPVHAWATLNVYRTERETTGKGDRAFLARMFQKLALNFTWWVNRKDAEGNNVFAGGFLGLDNIGVFDRSAPMPEGVTLEQADGTAWMALFSQNLFEIALELAEEDPSYEDMALKFLEHVCWIVSAMNREADGLWDEQDGFYYDRLRTKDGTLVPLRVRSLVGLLPLCAVTVYEAAAREKFPSVLERARAFLARHPEVTANLANVGKAGLHGRGILAVLSEDRLRRVLARLFDEGEFLGPHGVRSLSAWHREHPYELKTPGDGGKTWKVAYEPAESTTGMFGGNSNWRGPVWLPTNLLLIRALLVYYGYFGDEFRVEVPTGSGRRVTLFEAAQEIARRLLSIFVRDEKGRRAVFGGTEKFQTDPLWRDLIPFYEYFHGDEGAGLGASHQTGWTAIVARLLPLVHAKDGRSILSSGMSPGAELPKVKPR